jgi:hypothetical protein
VVGVGTLSAVNIHFIIYAALHTSFAICVERFISKVFIHWHDSCTLGFLNVLLVVRTWPPAKNCLEYSYLKWSLKGLFSRMCSYEVLEWPQGHYSVHESTSFVKWPSNASSTSTSHFLNNALGLMFGATCIQSLICSFCHLSCNLIHDY